MRVTLIAVITFLTIVVGLLTLGSLAEAQMTITDDGGVSTNYQDGEYTLVVGPVTPPDPNEPVEPPDPNEPVEPPDPNEPIDPPVEPPEPVEFGLVYTRQPRAVDPVAGTEVMDASSFQHASDVGRINKLVAEADLVVDWLNGQVEVIYDCTTDDTTICVAQEGRVSPDGTKIAFSVGFGEKFQEVRINGIDQGIYDTWIKWAQIWIYDIQTKEKWPVGNYPLGAIDRQPDWINNEKLVFITNREGVWPHKTPFGMHRGTNQFGKRRWFGSEYGVSQYYGWLDNGKAMQLWTMNIDGTDAKNIGPHDSMALAPMVATNGDIYYSCWNAHAQKGFDGYQRTSANPGTSINKWWLCRTDSNGADQTVVLNGHKSPTLKTRDYLANDLMIGGEGRSELRAIRSVSEYRKGMLAASNYYRANHQGSMGIVWSFSMDNPSVEGCSTAKCYEDTNSFSTAPGSGQYIPSDFKPLGPFGQDQDMEVRKDGQGRLMGKVGYAQPLPNTDDFLWTWCRGNCYDGITESKGNLIYSGGEPMSRKTIYRVKVDMVTDPFDPAQQEPLADYEEYHVWDADPIATYQDLYGQPLPETRPPLDESEGCYLQVVDIRNAELYPNRPFDWRKTFYSLAAFQGNAVSAENPNFHKENIQKLAVQVHDLWDETYPSNKFRNTSNNTGHMASAWASFTDMETDGSVKAAVPCETPITIGGTDAENRLIAHDDMLMSLRQGERRTCWGCHDGHSEERFAELGPNMVEAFSQTIAGQKPDPELGDTGDPIYFKQVLNVMLNRCGSCHEGLTTSTQDLWSVITQDYEQIDNDWAPKHVGMITNTSVSHVMIHAGGLGYQTGEQLIFPAGGAVGEIGSVTNSGSIESIKMVEKGSGYPNLFPVTVDSAGGNGAQLEGMTRVFELGRPYTSKWVAKYARDSMLYWACTGKREDGRTNDQYSNDIDWSDENAAIHANTCNWLDKLIMSYWIDLGIQRQ